MRSVAPFVGLIMFVLIAYFECFCDLAFECFAERTLNRRCQPFQWCKVLQAWVDDVNRHAEGFCYLLDGDVGHAYQFALLDAPDVLTCQSRSVGKLLLADAFQFAQGSDTLPNALCLLFLVHTA